MGYFNDRRKKEIPEVTGEKHSGDNGCMAFSNDSDALKNHCGCGFANMGMLPGSELSEERDFRMLQGMYPNQAKELLDLVEEECDRLEYEGSPMFDEYPDYTTIYTLQKRIADAARKKTGAAHDETSKKAGAIRDDAGAGMTGEKKEADGGSTSEELIRVMLLQEMHRRRARYRACSSVNAW